MTLPDRLPVAVGVKVTVTAQLAPAAKLLPQVLPVNAKSPILVPPIAMLVKVSVVIPSLVTVMLFGALVVPTFTLPKFTDGGVNLRGAAVPVMVTNCVPPLSATVKVPDCTPSVVGLNVTEMVHVPPAARVEPQVWV